ncbi:MAG: PocR ligand-binding domain-containing protein [Solirubrobacterales bacterium]
MDFPKTGPEGPIAGGEPGDGLTLDSLIGAPTLQAIQDSFAEVFDLPTGIFNPDGSPVTNITGRVSFCEDLTKGTVEGCERCRACDAQAYEEAARTQQPVIFECWNGLSDAVIPIAPKGRTIGYFLCGQVLSGPPNESVLRRSASEIGVDPDAYVAESQAIQVLPEERYRASVATMHVLAGMIADQAAAYIDNLRILDQSESAREDTRRLIGELDGILSAIREIGLQPTMRATLHSIADNLATLVPHDSCVIYGVEADELVPLVVRDPDPEPLWSFRPEIGVGIVGGAAKSRTARRCDDMRREPDFVPVPGLASEPEAALVVPVTDQGKLFGVIALSRLQNQIFTEHELSVLNVFSSQASVAIQRSQLQAEGAARLEEERALADLLRAMTGSMSAEETVAEVAKGALALLPASGVLASVTAFGAVIEAAEGISAEERRELEAALEREISEASTSGEPVEAQAYGRRALVVPLQTSDEDLGWIILVREGGDAPWDRRLADALSRQAALGVSNRLMHDRERRAARRYRALAELTAAVVAAEDEAGIAEVLVSMLPSLVGAQRCFVAQRSGESGSISVFHRDGRRIARQEVKLSGSARLAHSRLVGELAVDGAAFDEWAQAVWLEIAGKVGSDRWLAEPALTSSGGGAAIFVSWPDGHPGPAEEDRHTLAVVGDGAGARLEAVANQAETDDALRRRVDELQVMIGLAQRLTELDGEEAVAEELLSAFQALTGIEAVALCELHSGGHEVEVRLSREIGEEAIATIKSELRLSGAPDGAQLLTAGSGRDLSVSPVTGRPPMLLVGYGEDLRDPASEPVLGALSRYGAVALERIRLQDRQQKAISRLHRANVDATADQGRLEQTLALTSELTRSLLRSSGSPAVAAAVSELLGARVAIIDVRAVVLAATGPAAPASWTPAPVSETVIEPGETSSTIAAPVVLDEGVFAWLVVEIDGLVTAVQHAVVEHAAVLAALDQLRERAARDVATRLRHGFLDELLSGDFVEELATQRGQALGLDLHRPSRLYLVEAGSEEAAGLPGPAARVTDVVRGQGEHLVAEFDGVVVAIVSEESLDPDLPSRDDDPIEEQLTTELADLEGLRVVAGPVCREPGDYRRSFRAARRGLDFLRLVDRPGEAISFRRGGVEQLLLAAGDPASLLEFVGRYVAPLDAYDANHSSDLRHTLETLFANRGSLAPTARALHVHVSTLRYRLGRIEELVGVNPRSGDARLDLEVALRAARILPVHGASAQSGGDAQTSS